MKLEYYYSFFFIKCKQNRNQFIVEYDSDLLIWCHSVAGKHIAYRHCVLFYITTTQDIYTVCMLYACTC